MNVRRFRALHEAGASYAEIAAQCGVDWRTAKKYLQQPLGAVPPRATSRKGSQPRVIEAFTAVVDAMLRRDIGIKASVIHERLVAEHGFAHSYQRVKMYVAEARPRMAAELGCGAAPPLVGLHRRFEVGAGGQAQVDWGDEGGILAHVGIEKVYSFHMVLSWSRDPFICYTTSADLVTFFDCHRRAFAHFGGVPATIVYDRTKTVVKRHVAPGAAVPLHPEAAAFAEHYGFVIDVLAAYRPSGKGRVERQVDIGRAHVLAGRRFDSLAQMDAAFTAWVPIRHGQVHRTHLELIGDRALIDRAALRALPELPYLVAEAHLRRVGKDCLISFEASLYSVPARSVRAGQRVLVRASVDTLAITALPVDGGGVLAVHPRARHRGQWVVEQAHWDGLPEGNTRATILDPPPDPQRPRPATNTPEPSAISVLLSANPAAATPVAARSLRDYERGRRRCAWRPVPAGALVSAVHLWRRGDGTVLSDVDLSQAAPMLRDELHDIAWLLDLIEQWLRADEQGCDLFTDWLCLLGGHPGSDLSARGVIDELGRTSVMLHHILHAGVFDTGHPHPLTR